MGSLGVFGAFGRGVSVERCSKKPGRRGHRHADAMGEYRLDQLGWYQFERLCQTLLVSSLGLEVEAWGGSGDFGRDAYSPWSLRFPDPVRDQDGPFIFQAKFVDGAQQLGRKAITRLRAAIKAEALRIEERLADERWEDPTHYALLTNVTLDPSEHAGLLKPIAGLLPATRLHLLAERQIEVMLTASASVRLSFPQLLSIRDLKGLLADVLNRDLSVRSRTLLKDAADLAEVFVPARPWYKALDVLTRHHFVVLTGPPEMGKTAIAQMVALAQAAEGWDVVACRSPNDVERAHVADHRQIFVADDAFGSTEYRAQSADEWGQAMPEMLALIDAHHWLVWTSRSQPLVEALDRVTFGGRAANFPAPARVTVDATRLEPRDKALMLYRHAKAAGLSAEAKQLIRSQALGIVSSPHFTPLRVRRFVSERCESLVGKSSDLIGDAVRAELETPTDGMIKSLTALDDDHRRLLHSMLDIEGDADVRAVESAFARHNPEAKVSAREALRRLEEHFLVVR